MIAGEMERDTETLDVRISSDVRHIDMVVADIVRLAASWEYQRKHLALNLPVALTEALSNAILRGNREDPAKSVRVRAELTAERLVVEVSDEGVGFDLAACTADPTAAGNIMREDGRGLFLMQKLMTRVERFTDGGNVVRLVLHRG
ncbi:MAG: ATP-binding protein [bacterium]|jgi:serine/threonine-protein kinase RsbW|nr:ATP-binding protein [bacterium]